MKRSGPPKRKTPLRAKAPAKDRPRKPSTPIKVLGRRGRRLDPMRERCKREVRRRSGGVCEVPGCQRTDVAWAHLFGRGNIVPEPLASSPELTMDLCSTHHDAIDRGFDLDLRERLRWLAVEKVAEVTDIPQSQLEQWRSDRSAKDGLLTLMRWAAEYEAA